MTRLLLISLFSVIPVFGANNLLASERTAMAESHASLVGEEPILTINGSNIRVQNAQGETLEIYNITGLRVLSRKIDRYDFTVSLKLPKG